MFKSNVRYFCLRLCMLLPITVSATHDAEICLDTRPKSLPQGLPNTAKAITAMQTVGETAPTTQKIVVKGRITDANTGEPLSARVVLRNTSGQVVDSYYTELPGFFTEPDGTFVVSLEPGNYTYEVTRGFDYTRSTGKLIVTSQGSSTLDVPLKPWVNLKKLGWYTGDAHAHIVSDTPKNADMIALAHKIAKAQGLDFLFAVQNWGGYDETNWADAQAIGSDDQFKMLFGAEMPKQRFGHTWWIGLNNTCGYYNHGMDQGYSRYFRSTGPLFSEEHYPLLQMPSSEVVPRLRQAKDAIAVHAHPTSWWWQGTPNTQFITNISADLIPDLLSGGLWDGLVVMGYDHDHYFYQNLWFWILNMGYRITPFAELDGGLPTWEPNYYGAMRTYFHLNGPFSVPALIKAAREGHTFVTSGPILFANVDDTYEVGDIVPLDSHEHRLNIDVYASGEFDDYISFVIVFRNGKIHRIWDDRATKPKHVQHSLDINETEKSWYVVKAYGSHTWPDTKLLDVMTVSHKAETDPTIPISKHGSHDIALTSPFYFWPPDTTAPGPLISHINLKLVDSQGEPIRQATVTPFLLGKAIAEYSATDGSVSFDMPVNAWLEIKTPEGPTIHRSLFVDYAPYNDILYTLISGAWTQQAGLKDNIKPGRVPTWAFNFDKAKQVLTDVSWTIPVVENARDPEWDRLETLGCPP